MELSIKWQVLWTTCIQYQSVQRTYMVLSTRFFLNLPVELGYNACIFYCDEKLWVNENWKAWISPSIAKINTWQNSSNWCWWVVLCFPLFCSTFVYLCCLVDYVWRHSVWVCCSFVFQWVGVGCGWMGFLALVSCVNLVPSWWWFLEGSSRR